MKLDDTYKKDKGLLKFYKKNLLVPGWAGELNQEEYDYIRENLKENPQLKTNWGFKAGARRLSEKRIREIAVMGANRF